MTTDAYITTTGERWTVDNDGAMCLADKSGVAAYLIDDQRIYAELRALRAQRDEKAAEWGYYDEEIARCREIVSQYRGGAEPSEELHNDVRQLVDDVVALRAQRDELLAALVRMRLWVSESGGVRLWYGSMGDDGQGHDEGEWRASEMLSEIDALIARAKGGA